MTVIELSPEYLAQLRQQAHVATKQYGDILQDVKETFLNSPLDPLTGESCSRTPEERRRGWIGFLARNGIIEKEADLFIRVCSSIEGGNLETDRQNRLDHQAGRDTRC